MGCQLSTSHSRTSQREIDERNTALCNVVLSQTEAIQTQCAAIINFNKITPMIHLPQSLSHHL